MVKSIPFGDKIGHFFLFGTLSYLGNITLKFRILRLGNLKLYIGTAIVLGFVIIEECSQIFIISRTFDYSDLAADILGITLGTFAAYFSKSFFITE